MIDNAKKNKIMNILNSGKSKFTEKDIDALSELPLINAEKSVSREQAYYDKLKPLNREELIKRDQELSCSIYNKQIEQSMIHNLLALRNIGSRGSDNVIFERGRFVKNTTEENKRYGL